jgi:5-methylcytosine-specific restriction endonuclease McrA
MKKYGVNNWDIYVRDKCVCQYCGLNGCEFGKWRQLTIDHLLPENSGGTNEPPNLIVACNRCNQLKENFVKGANINLNNIPPRDELIKMARDYVDQNRKKDQEIEAFTAMMREL